MPQQLQDRPAGHETRDVSVRPILYAGAVLAVVAAVVLGISTLVFRFFISRPVDTPVNPMAAANAPYPPAPRLEDHPSDELHQLRAQEDHVLTTYGWVDRQSGVVRIPIERAIELQLQRGFPTRKDTNAGKEGNK